MRQVVGFWGSVHVKGLEANVGRLILINGEFTASRPLSKSLWDFLLVVTYRPTYSTYWRRWRHDCFVGLPRSGDANAVLFCPPVTFVN